MTGFPQLFRRRFILLFKLKIKLRKNMKKHEKGNAMPSDFYRAKVADINNAIEYKVPFVDSESNFIYFLLNRGVVVYVGKTKCVVSRINQHLKEKEFDEVYYDPTPYTHTESLAIKLRTIIEHDPAYNSAICDISNCGFTSIAKFRKRFYPRPSTVLIKKLRNELMNTLTFRGLEYYDPEELKRVYERSYDCVLTEVACDE